MRRPFLWLGVSFALGILAGRFVTFPDSPLFLLTLSLFPALWISRGKPVFLSLLLISLFSMGGLRIHAALRLAPDDISHFAQGKWTRVEGKVATLPELREKGRRRIYSFVLKTEKAATNGKSFSVRGKAQVFLFNPAEAPNYGGRVSIWGKLAVPRASQNPGEFDYRKYLAEQGIRVVLEGYGSHSLKLLNREASFFLLPAMKLERLRERSAQRIDSLFSPPVNGLLKALILGLRKDLPEGLRDDFIKTATAHLIAISGMNITLMAGSIYFLALCLGFPQKGAALFGLLSTVGYVFVSGMGIPVVRAGWMSGIFFGGLLLEREKDLTNSLFLALFLILVFDPLALFQVGFQLSFLSVLSLIAFSRMRSAPWQGEWFQTLTVSMGTFPLCIAYFNVFSWMSLLANFLAIPLFHLGNLGGITSLFLGPVPLVGPFFIKTTALCLKAGLAWIHFCSQRSWGYFHLASPSWKMILVYYGALAFFIATQKLNRPNLRRLKPFAASAWLLSALLFFLPHESQTFALTILSAGNNELLHVEFPGRNHWLVNAGRRAPSNQARWILNPFLRHAGVKHLKGIFLTDFSTRHTGGLATVLDNFSVDSLMVPAGSEVPPEFSSQWNSFRFRRLARFSLYRGDRVTVHPQGSFQIVELAEGGAFLLIDFQGQKFLFLSTWKRKALEQALRRFKDLGPVNVLILPATGRPDSSQWETTLSLLAPDWVVFPGRTHNSRLLLPSLRREEIPFFFVSKTGALRFEMAGDGLGVFPYFSVH